MADNVHINRRIESGKTINVRARQRIFDIGKSDTVLLEESDPFDRLRTVPCFVSIDGYFHCLSHTFPNDP